MIPLDELVSEGLMDSSELPAKSSSAQAADFNTVNEFREPLLVKVADRLLSDSKHANLRKQMDAFRSENAWVEVSLLDCSPAALQGYIAGCTFNAVYFETKSMQEAFAEHWPTV